MSTHQVKKIVREYAECLNKNRVRFKQIYLFGSFASGKAHEWSDIDVAVIVNKTPRGMGRLKANMRLRKLTAGVDVRIEPILLGEKDIVEKTASIMGDEVRRHGILVVEQ